MICVRCGKVDEHRFWSEAATAGATHEHQPVRVIGVISREAWARIPREYRTRNAVLRLDSDGSGPAGGRQQDDQ
jgi:hypothetical protein